MAEAGSSVDTPLAPGIRSLDKLLSTFVPTLAPTCYAYVNVPLESSKADKLAPTAFLIMQEPAGLNGDSSPEDTTTTLILPLDVARQHTGSDTESEQCWPCELITLNIQSSLEAVGFFAKISAELTKNNISANCVSGFWRDYLFVPYGRGKDAVKVLEAVKRGAGDNTTEVK